MKAFLRIIPLVLAAITALTLSGCGNTRVNLYIRDNGAFDADYIAEIVLDSEYLSLQGADSLKLKDYLCAAGIHCGFTPEISGNTITFSRKAKYYKEFEPGSEAANDARIFVKRTSPAVRKSCFIIDYVEETYENPLKDVNSLISRFSKLDAALENGFSVTSGGKPLEYKPFAEAFPMLEGDRDKLNLVNRAFNLLYSTNLREANSTAKGNKSFEFFYRWEVEGGGDNVIIKSYRVNTVAAYLIITLIAVAFIVIVAQRQRKKMKNEK